MSTRSKDPFAPKQNNTPGFRGKGGNRKSRFPEVEKTRILKTLQMNGFNYELTARQTGVSTKSLKVWREQMPEAFNNQYTNKSLATIEHIAKEEAAKVTKHAGDLLQRSLRQAEIILEFETDLSKIASFIRAITPLAKTLDEVNNKNGYEKVSSLTQTLEKLARLNGGDIQDVVPDEED
jgi:transposase-like protein